MKNYDVDDLLYEEKMERLNAAEALSWLQETGELDLRTISGSNGSDDEWPAEVAIQIVQELYSLGAVKITAIEIEGRDQPDAMQYTSTLIIELPQESAKRVSLFAWSAGFARATGWDPPTDEGQKYLLLWRD